MPGQGGGEYGAPGSGDTTGYVQTGSFGDYTDDDFVKPRKGGRWLKRSFYTVLALAVIGGGLYGGWRWTQTQYYVGVNGEHVALYRGISQDLAWVSLSKVSKDHPEIELKYLPPYQQKSVEGTIAEGDLKTAQKKIDELSVQASACKKEAAAEAAESGKNSKTGQGEAAWAPREPHSPPSRPRPHRPRRARPPRPRTLPHPRPRPLPPPAPPSRTRRSRSSGTAVRSRQAVRGPVTR